MLDYALPEHSVLAHFYLLSLAAYVSVYAGTPCLLCALQPTHVSHSLVQGEHALAKNHRRNLLEDMQNQDPRQLDGHVRPRTSNTPLQQRVSPAASSNTSEPPEGSSSTPDEPNFLDASNDQWGARLLFDVPSYVTQCTSHQVSA